MKNFYSLFKKDCQMMIAGKFIFVAFGSLLIYTLFINFGYVHYMNAKLYNVYLYDPQGTQQEVSELIFLCGFVRRIKYSSFNGYKWSRN